MASVPGCDLEQRRHDGIVPRAPAPGTRSRSARGATIRWTTTSKRSGATPSGSVRSAGGEVVDAGDVEALQPARRRAASGTSSTSCVTGRVQHPLAARDHDQGAVEQLGFGRGVRRHRLVGGGGASAIVTAACAEGDGWGRGWPSSWVDLDAGAGPPFSARALRRSRRLRSFVERARWRG